MGNPPMRGRILLARDTAIPSSPSKEDSGILPPAADDDKPSKHGVMQPRMRAQRITLAAEAVPISCRFSSRCSPPREVKPSPCLPTKTWNRGPGATGDLCEGKGHQPRSPSHSSSPVQPPRDAFVLLGVSFPPRLPPYVPVPGPLDSSLPAAPNCKPLALSLHPLDVNLA